MTWDGARRRLVRLGGAMQLVVVTAVAASFVGTLSGPLWRQSRPGCVMTGMVTCAPQGIDLVARWPATLLGGLLALVVALAAGRVRRAAQWLVVVVVTMGTALFAADQARYSGDSALLCYPTHGHGCAYPAWTVGDLIAGAAVGVVLGLLAVAGEQAGRCALDAPAPGARRVLVGVLMVGGVPVGLVGLLGCMNASDSSSQLAALGIVLAGVLSLVLGRVLRTRKATELAGV